jgi:hypothetical protein
VQPHPEIRRLSARTASRRVHEVSTLVNSPRNDTEECVVPRRRDGVAMGVRLSGPHGAVWRLPRTFAGPVHVAGREACWHEHTRPKQSLERDAAYD